MTTTGGGGVASLTLPEGRSGTVKDILGRLGRGGIRRGCDVIEGIETGPPGGPSSVLGATENGGMWMGARGSDSTSSVVVVPTEKGDRDTSMGVLFIGGLPLGLTLPLASPGRQAEETFLGPLRWVASFGLDGVTADCGSRASSQKEFRDVGVIADCGHRISGVCWMSLGVQGAPVNLDGSADMGPLTPSTADDGAR
jgi:hypothetical protein